MQGLAVAAGITLAATAACTDDTPAPPQAAELRAVHSSPAPLSSFYDVAVVSDVACTINSFETQIHCVNRTDAGVTVFGRQGGGPGEFLGLLGIERGPDGRVVVLDGGSGRLISFNPDGIVASTDRMPSGFYPSQLRGGHLFGYRLGAMDFTSATPLPDFIPMAVDIGTGETVWERTDLAELMDRECFTGAVGAWMPDGSLVFEVCGHELGFLARNDATEATVTVSPHRSVTFPGSRDIEDRRALTTAAGRRAGMPDSEIDRLVDEFRSTPREWILKPVAFGFDGRERLWVATTLDRTGFSYFDVWAGTEYAGMVRVEGRVLGFDILEATLVTLVERSLTEWALDWYDIGSVLDDREAGSFRTTGLAVEK